ncbi:MAG TPA: DUF4846 domain-containing protein, partial [Spirochaetota bacterium]|nr:DUF4846 domain-containing protein [Spirochaetota bacterium]
TKVNYIMNYFSHKQRVKIRKAFKILFLFLLSSCSLAGKTDTSGFVINSSAQILSERFVIPASFKRIDYPADSFQNFLRSFPLRRYGTPVKLFDGSLKNRQDVHCSILDIDTGKKDLQQCADAVMRLRAEYLYKTGQYEKIHFNFSNGFRADYHKWKLGYRIRIRSNQVSWIKTAEADNSRKTFREYLDVVFMYAGSASLERELKKVPISKVSPGDVLIQGGSPGHALIVMDTAEDIKTGRRIFILAQSYMPAQDIHIVINPENEEISPWYEADPSVKQINTPEWNFTIDDLMRFKD